MTRLTQIKEVIDSSTSFLIANSFNQLPNEQALRIDDDEVVYDSPKALLGDSFKRRLGLTRELSKISANSGMTESKQKAAAGGPNLRISNYHLP